MGLYEVSENAASVGADRIIVLDRRKGGFGRIRFLRIGQEIVEVPPCLNIIGAKFRREYGSHHKTPSSLFIDELGKAELGIDKLKRSLSDFLDLPIMNASEASSEYEAAMRVISGSSRHVEIGFYTWPRNIEVGPRIFISHVAW